MEKVLPGNTSHTQKVRQDTQHSQNTVEKQEVPPKNDMVIGSSGHGSTKASTLEQLL